MLRTIRPMPALVAAAFSLTGLSIARADINLVWDPPAQVVNVGSNFTIDLYAVSDDMTNQSIATIDAILAWNPGFIQLTGLINSSPYAWQSSNYPNDCGLDGLNGNPACPGYTGVSANDGNGLYRAQRNLVAPAFATPAGLLVATLTFQALAETPTTSLTIPANFGANTQSMIIDGFMAGLDVTGTLGSAKITIVPEPASIALLIGGLAHFARRRRA